MTNYQEIKEQIKLQDLSLPFAGTNEDGENVIIENGNDSEGGRFYRLTTAQANGWCRINTYWEDGTTEETYKKGMK